MKIGFHKDVFKPSLLKSIAVFLVFVFAWTNMGIYQVVYAATNGVKSSGVESSGVQDTESSPPSFPRNRESSLQFTNHSPEQALEKAVEKIRATISKPQSVIPVKTGIQSPSSATGATSEVQSEIIKERAELEQADVNIRSQFKQTEAKIKNLPSIIQQRQKTFEKKYEKNFVLLKSELDSINTAKTSTQFTARTRELKAFLDKIKPPSRHIKFNPNKLPHRMAKPVWREPRMHYGRQHRVVGSEGTQTLSLRGDESDEAISDTHRPHPNLPLRGEGTSEFPLLLGEDKGEVYSDDALIQLASLTTNNLLKDGSQYPGVSFDSSSLLPPGHPSGAWVGESRSEGDVPNGVIPTKVGIQKVKTGFRVKHGMTEGNYQPIQVASIGSLNGILSSAIVQTIPPPTAADLTSSTEVQFTPAILAKALELGYNATNIYNWVYNNIEYVPTYGSIQGADMCLQTMQCNDMDTASLLIALLRASNIPARYVYGTIQLPIQQIMNWVGGFTDPKAALTLIASGGIPIKGIVSGGSVTKAQMEHAWVEAYVPYGPYSGRPSPLNVTKTWVPLDASYKQFTYTSGIDLQTAVPFDVQSFINQITSTATINEAQSYVTNVDYNYITTTVANYQTQLSNYISQTITNPTVSDIIGGKSTETYGLGILPVSLPYTVISKGWEDSAVPDSLRYKVLIEVPGPNYYATGQPGISYTVSLPEISGKQVSIYYTPATSADQSVINSYITQSATALPIYLINVEPVLMINGNIVATGTETQMGYADTLNVTMNSPSGDTEYISHELNEGDYGLISIAPGKINQDVIQNRLNNADYSEPVGEMLYQIGLCYWGELDAFNYIIAKTQKVVAVRLPSEALVSAPVDLTFLLGMPYYGSYKERSIDVKSDLQVAVNQNGLQISTVPYFSQSGIVSSSLEGNIFDQLFGRPIGDGISAVRLLEDANEQGIPIYQINQDNISTTINSLSLSSDVKVNIQNAVNAGDTAFVPQSEVNHNGWVGVGYIVQDPTTGYAVYMINGGLAGGGQTTSVATLVPIPQIPASGISVFLIGNLASSEGIALDVAGGAIVGIDLPAIGAALALAALIVLIIELAKTISDTISRNAPPENWIILRHYTNAVNVLSISVIGIIGKDPRGIFLTDLKLNPTGIMPDGTPNNVYIANALGLRDDEGNIDPSKATGFVEIKINLVAFPPGTLAVYQPCSLQNVQPCNEWLYKGGFLEVNSSRVQLINSFP